MEQISQKYQAQPTLLRVAISRYHIQEIPGIEFLGWMDINTLTPKPMCLRNQRPLASVKGPVEVSKTLSS